MIRKKPKVAVLLAAYNGKKYIYDQIESILSQKDIDLNLFINVDLSNDGTEEYVKSIAEKNNRVNLLKCGNSFKSASKNFYHLFQNVNVEAYDFVSLSDQDDIWKNDKIIRGIRYLQNNSCDAYSSNVEAYWETGLTKKINKSQNQRLFDHYFESPGPGCTFILSNKLSKNLKKFISENQNEVNEFHHHDWMIYAFSRENGYKWIIDEYYSMYYRQHDENELGVNIGFRAFFHRLKQVFSGEAIRKHLQLARLLKFKNYNLPASDFIERKLSLHLFLNSSMYRRKYLDQILFQIFWLLALIIGLKKQSLQLNIFALFNSLIAISLLFLIYLIIKQDNTEINLYNLLNISDLFLIIFFSLTYNLITSKRFLVVINSKKFLNLKFIFWNSYFVKGQILGYLIPQSGVVYRAFILKEIHGFSYSKYTGLYILLISFEIFLLSLVFLLISVLFFSNNNSSLYLAFIPIIYILLFTLVTLVSLFKFKFVIRLLKKIRFYWLKVIIIETQIMFVRMLLYKKNLFLFIIFSILKIIFGLALYYLVLRLFESSIEFNQTVYFFTANQLFEPFKITPQNLGIMELIFGIIAVQVSLSIKIGIFVKVVLRLIDMISLLVLLILQKIFQIFLYNNKNSLL